MLRSNLVKNQYRIELNTSTLEDRNGNRSMALGMLLMLEMAALLGESDEVGEKHAAEADVIERLDGVSLDVLCVVVIQSPLHRTLDVIHGHHRLQVFRHFLHFHPLNLVVESPHRHSRRDPIQTLAPSSLSLRSEL